MIQPVYDVAEAAVWLRCHPKTVKRFIASGALRATKPAGQWLIQYEDLVAYLNQGENVSRTAESRRRRRRRAA